MNIDNTSTNRNPTWIAERRKTCKSRIFCANSHFSSPSTCMAYFPWDVQHCCHDMFVFPRLLSVTPHTGAKISSHKKLRAASLLMLAQMLAHLEPLMSPVKDCRVYKTTNDDSPYGFLTHTLSDTAFPPTTPDLAMGLVPESGHALTLSCAATLNDMRCSAPPQMRQSGPRYLHQCGHTGCGGLLHSQSQCYALMTHTVIVFLPKRCVQWFVLHCSCSLCRTFFGLFCTRCWCACTWVPLLLWQS